MMKRSSDGQYGDMSSNGSMMTDSNDAKKARLDSVEPSRVLHIRGVPSDCTEAEIVQLGIPFGRMTNLVLAKKKNQALLEMSDLQTAEAMYESYREKPALVRGRTVHVQYSNHQKLKVEANLPVNAGAQAALEAADNLMSSGDVDSGSAHTVLRIIIDNMLYPITVDILHKIFSKYGQVTKIVTFTKNGQFQSLLQYSDAIAAHTAKQTLNGQNIYNGCCTLRVDLSKLTSLNVKFNNDKTWDYTNPDLPSGEMGGMGGHGSMMDDGILGSYDGGYGGGMGGGMGSMRGLGGGGGMGGLNIPSLTAMSGLGLGGALGSMGGMGAVGGLDSRGGDYRGGDYRGGSDRRDDRRMGGRDDRRSGGSMGRMGGGRDSRGGGGDGSGCIVIVSNLNEEKITPELIFKLFGSYGNVMRVKILFNKKDTAFVQYADPMMAQNAISNLDRCSWMGKEMKISMSKHSYVQMPREDAADAWMTKDFSNSPMNRFRNPNSKSFTSVAYSPTNTLHLSNIPEGVTEDEIRDLFSEHGRVTDFKFFANNKKMALIQLDSQDDAINCLAEMHNYELQPRQYLRVSFTKSVI